MSVTELGGIRIEREIPDVGLLAYEECEPGQWLTARGEPAKKGRRRYLLDDREIPSVSSITDTLSKAALMNWIEKQATIGAVQAQRMGELDGVHESDWVERVKSLGLGASAKKDEGADRGKLIHNTFEALAMGQPTPNPAEVPALARPWIQGAIRAWMTLNPVPVAVEEMVCHPELEYAGRPDLVGTVDGQLVCLDWKTGAKGRVYPEAHYQTMLYCLALRRLGVDVAGAKIIGIADNGGFEIIDCAVQPEDALSLLAVFKSRKAVNASMAAQRKIARAAANA